MDINFENISTPTMSPIFVIDCQFNQYNDRYLGFNPTGITTRQQEIVWSGAPAAGGRDQVSCSCSNK